METGESLHQILEKIELLSAGIENYQKELESLKKEVLAVAQPQTKVEAGPPGVLKLQVVKKPGLENFVGLKLITLVGIIVLIVGLTIGVKYVIDINLISPLMRISLTYVAGLALFFISLRLRKKYEVFSLILFSGAMASIYFTTYAAYEYYQLLSQIPAFVLMLLFTVFTVYNAIRYNRREIAILGLVGAYGIPFFVRGNSENVVALFNYIMIINVGVFFVSIKKYWLSLAYLTFFTTWAIYFSWLLAYDFSSNHQTGLLYAFLFFSFFILNALVFKMVKRIPIGTSDIFLIVADTLLFYFSLLLLFTEYGHVYKANFTLCMGIGYLMAALAVKRFTTYQQHFYDALFCISLAALAAFAGLRFVSFTITLTWVILAVGLFVIGITAGLKIFRIAAIVLFAITLFKLLFIDSAKFTSLEKVIAYLVLGVVLLVISFLYQKYKKVIFGEDTTGKPQKTA